MALLAAVFKEKLSRGPFCFYTFGMIGKATLPLYCITIALSAALLFSVQPMFSKMILPYLGGSAQVWTVAMVFFQCALLGGYALAFFTNTHLSPVKQALVLIGGLALWMLISLPFTIAPEQAESLAEHNPLGGQLTLMLVTIGGPFLFLSSLAPVIQRWFSLSQKQGAQDPYFLYSASNIGSLGALIAYPFLIERIWPVQVQAEIWMYGYAALALLLALCVLALPRGLQQTAIAKQSAEKILTSRKLRWVFLAFVPSSLMLGVTHFITTDIASTPLLWIIPLCLYLLSYILAFAAKPWLSERQIQILQNMLLVVMLVLSMGIEIGRVPLIFVHLALFFACALNAHSRLAADRPAAENLGIFYLCIALGGALGGFFNALIAPVIFILPWEYMAGLCLACFTGARSLAFSRRFRDYMALAIALAMIWAIYELEDLSETTSFILTFLAITPLVFLWEKPAQLSFMTALILLLFPPNYVASFGKESVIVHQSRNFYGTSRVLLNRATQTRHYIHGTTLHGTQSYGLGLTQIPLSYYAEYSALNAPVEYLESQKRLSRMAVIGLGVGSMACLVSSNTHIDYLEIDPDVRDIAENEDLFTYLRDCPAKHSILMGDGRLSMAKQPDSTYDLIVVDAFSSDNIPMHLITNEAVSLYRRKLKPDGILVFHTSNNYLNLSKPLSAIAQAQGVSGLWGQSDSGTIPGTDLRYFTVQAFALTANADAEAYLLFQKNWQSVKPEPGEALWTDQFSNMLSALVLRFE